MMSPQPRFIFFGTPYVARDTLAILVERGFVPEVVVTSPDAPRGRGQKLTPCETKEWAAEHDLSTFAPEKLDEQAVQTIKELGCDYAIVVAYGKIFPETLIQSFPKGVLNIHYSKLPKYRGASPVEAALLNDDAVTGVALQKMVRELDAGDVIALRETPIGPTETTKELRARLIVLGAELLVEVLPDYLAGKIPGTPQDHSKATRSGKIAKSEGELSLTGDAETNWRKYRAYAESPGTYFFVERDGKRMRVKITKASFSPKKEFLIERVIPEGKKEMPYADFNK